MCSILSALPLTYHSSLVIELWYWNKLHKNYTHSPPRHEKQATQSVPWKVLSWFSIRFCSSLPQGDLLKQTENLRRRKEGVFFTRLTAALYWNWGLSSAAQLRSLTLKPAMHNNCFPHKPQSSGQTKDAFLTGEVLEGFFKVSIQQQNRHEEKVNNKQYLYAEQNSKQTQTDAIH